MSTQRRFFVGGNWKMNGNKASIDEIVKNLADTNIPEDTGTVDQQYHAARVNTNSNDMKVP